LRLAGFGDKWVAASVLRSPRRAFLATPVGILDSLRASNKGAVIQAFDARYVVSVRQIHAAAVAAHLAFKAGANISKKMEIELLLRLAADTQIGRVLERLGVREGTEEVGFCILADERSLAVRISDDLARAVGGTEVDDDYLRGEGRLAKAIEFYGIEMAEIESVQARDKAEAILILILERIATLDLRR
jgi:tRNA threonylcarbamoyladenosine modification (KEOPS) complex Cgi121 subunit